MSSVLKVDYSSLKNNLKVLSEKKEVLIPVKANAYGLGYDIVDFFLSEGYLNYGVSTIKEAIIVRKKSKEAKILLFGSVFLEDLDNIKKYNITISVYDFEMLNIIDKDISFHLKFDLGMGRLGFLKDQKEEVLNIIKEKNLLVSGIYTHFPATDNYDLTIGQIQNFKNIVDYFKSSIDIEYVHMFNGVGALKYNTDFDNLIRPGLATYGYFSNMDIKKEIGNKIKESLELCVRVGHKKEYDDFIGYDMTQKVKGNVITIPLGYHDGLKMQYQGYKIKNIGEFVGKICMCQSMILLDDNNINKGDWISIFKGEDIYKLSSFSGVSVYEIIATLGNRIKREYIKGE